MGYNQRYYKRTPTKEELQSKLQLIFCKQRKHWAVATTLNCDSNKVAVYDSLFAFLDKESLQIVESLFTCYSVKPCIKMIKCPKQKGSKDCGLYAIAIATSLASIKTTIQIRCNEITPCQML